MAKWESGFRGLRETMERCSEIVTDAYSLPIEQLQIYAGELPPGHRSTDRRQRFMVTEHNGDLVVALPGTTHPLDWSSNLRVGYTPVDGSMPPADTTTEQLEQVPCAHAGFFYRAETVPTVQLLQQAADKGCRLVLTGHSLGGAVANLCALTALTAQRRALEAAASRAAPVQANGHKRRKSRAKAALRSISGSVASANTSCCSGNGDVHISAQAALVEVLCVSFASPLYANSALAQLIADNGWDDCFVNVVVPEDYCLKLFNNVLTSAPQPDGIVRTASSNSFKATKQQLEYAEILDDPFDKDPLPESPMADPFELVAAMPFKQGTAGSSSCSSMDSSGGSARRRFSYQGSSQPLASALAGKRSSKPMRSRRQLSFAQPVHQHVTDGGFESGTDSSSPDLSGAAAGATAPAATCAATGAAPADDESVMMRLPAIACCPQDIRLCEEEPGSNWSHMPSSPSAASLLSESSWSSTRSWRLLAYLPEVLSRSLSSSTRSLSSMDGSRASSTTPSESGSAAAGASSTAAGAAPSSSGGATARQGMRHAQSSVELSRPQQQKQGGLASSSSSSSLCSLDDLQASNVAAGMAAEQPDTSSRQQLHMAPTRSSLRRSLSSASLTLLQPLSSVSSLLPTMRAVRSVSRRALHAATAVAERAFSIPLDVLEVGLVKALQPPMYTPVGQQWVLSATGLVPQNQPIAQYPRHVHDVFWHKELMMVAFREHSIVFYKQRLLQQARRR